jgi:hypothetical protein
MQASPNRRQIAGFKMVSGDPFKEYIKSVKTETIVNSSRAEA